MIYALNVVPLVYINTIRENSVLYSALFLQFNKFLIVILHQIRHKEVTREAVGGHIGLSVVAELRLEMV